MELKYVPTATEKVMKGFVELKDREKLTSFITPLRLLSESYNARCLSNNESSFLNMNSE